MMNSQKKNIMMIYMARILHRNSLTSLLKNARHNRLYLHKELYSNPKHTRHVCKCPPGIKQRIHRCLLLTIRHFMRTRTINSSLLCSNPINKIIQDPRPSNIWIIVANIWETYLIAETIEPHPLIHVYNLIVTL